MLHGHIQKMFAAIRVCTLSILIIKCCGIGPEYYMGNELENENYKVTVTISKSRKFGDKEETLDISSADNLTVSHNDSNFDYYSYEDDYFKVYVATEKTPQGVSTESVTTDEKNNYTNISILRQNEPKFANLTTNKISTVNDFDEYQYVYEDKNESGQPPQQLRQFINPNQTDNYDFNNDSAAQYDNDSLRYLADFYNLEPAVGKINITIPVNNTKKLISNSVWYVSERYPCWELPVLYAELGRRLKTSDVFLIHSGNLKNVIDSGTEDIPPPKSFVISAAQSLNKWCAAQPCYGDHTLCIFSNKHISKMCDDGYKVIAPTMIEQMALVNIVNSMRNRVANGVTDQYSHLPPAANMKQIIYDYDLEDMAMAWLHQCLPGPAPCSALDGNYVTQLECTKYAEHCCLNSYKSHTASKCIPEFECFVLPVTGCIHAWFCSAGQKLSEIDINCGHIAPLTFNTVQLIWADTNKIGCAFGQRPNGDVRVVCNFAPGAPFQIDTKYYCGFIAHKDVTKNVDLNKDITDLKYLATLGINLKPITNTYNDDIAQFKFFDNFKNVSNILRSDELDSLYAIYQRGWLSQKTKKSLNGTKGLIARLVTRYSFYEESESRCDLDEPIYVAGEPGSMCVERGRRFNALCYDFRDPTPGYRLVAVVAPVALFSLILYDLFSVVMRQTNY